MRKSMIGIGILVFTIGLMMVIAPDEVVKVAVIVLGAAAIANGGYNLLTVRKLVPDRKFHTLITVRGFISLGTGLLAIFLPLVLAGTIWTAMIYVIAVYLLISAGIEVYGILKLRDAGMETKTFIGEIVGSLILAIILFLMPAAIGKALLRILGIVVFLFGLGIIYWEWRSKPDYVYAEDVEVEDAEDESIKEE